jgi:hypothetical protein
MSTTSRLDSQNLKKSNNQGYTTTKHTTNLELTNKTMMISLVSINDQINIQEEEASIRATILGSPTSQNRKKLQEGSMSNTRRKHKQCNNSHHGPESGLMTRLDKSFTPGNFDVICARGSDAKNHTGNIHLKNRVAGAADSYAKAPSKVFKSLIVSSIIGWVRTRSPNGGFVKQLNDGVWYEVGDEIAREKVGQALRDKNHTHYKSSMKAKRRRWKKEKQEQSSEQQQEKYHQSPPGEEGDEALNTMLRNHHEAIQLSLHNVEQKWIEYGRSNANDDQLLDLFTQHNIFLLKTLKADAQTPEHIDMLL